MSRSPRIVGVSRRSMSMSPTIGRMWPSSRPTKSSGATSWNGSAAPISKSYRGDAPSIPKGGGSRDLHH
jgi:hypothetical protein